MNTKELWAADKMRLAISGRIAFTKDIRDKAIIDFIEKVEADNARANAARAKGLHCTANLLDRMVDAKMEEIDRMLSLPITTEDTSSWSIA